MSQGRSNCERTGYTVSLDYRGQFKHLTFRSDSPLTRPFFYEPHGNETHGVYQCFQVGKESWSEVCSAVQCYRCCALRIEADFGCFETSF